MTTTSVLVLMFPVGTTKYVHALVIGAYPTVVARSTDDNAYDAVIAYEDDVALLDDSAYEDDVALLDDSAYDAEVILPLNDPVLICVDDDTVPPGNKLLT